MACVLGTALVTNAVMFLPGTVVDFADGKPAARAAPRRDWRDWRDVATGASSVARSFAWRRHFDKTIRAIDRARGQP
jgi:hypothetical protein